MLAAAVAVVLVEAVLAVLDSWVQCYSSWATAMDVALEYDDVVLGTVSSALGGDLAASVVVAAVLLHRAGHMDWEVVAAGVGSPPDVDSNRLQDRAGQDRGLEVLAHQDLGHPIAVQEELPRSLLDIAVDGRLAALEHCADSAFRSTAHCYGEAAVLP